MFKKYLYPSAHYVRVWGKMGEFEGESTGTPFLASLGKGWALFAASSDPTGGRSLTGIDSRAKGFLPPQGKT